MHFVRRDEFIFAFFQFRCYEFNEEPKMIFSGNSKIVYIFESALILPMNLIIANE